MRIKEKFPIYQNFRLNRYHRDQNVRSNPSALSMILGKNPLLVLRNQNKRRSFGPLESGQKRPLPAVVSGQKRSIAATDLGRSPAAPKSKQKRQVQPDESGKQDQTNHKKAQETPVPKSDKQIRPNHNKSDQTPVPKPRRVPAPQIKRPLPTQAAVVEKQDEVLAAPPEPRPRHASGVPKPDDTSKSKNRFLVYKEKQRVSNKVNAKKISSENGHTGIQHDKGSAKINGKQMINSEHGNHDDQEASETSNNTRETVSASQPAAKSAKGSVHESTGRKPGDQRRARENNTTKRPSNSSKGAKEQVDKHPGSVKNDSTIHGHSADESDGDTPRIHQMFPFSVHKESAPPLVPVDEQTPAQTDSAEKRDEEKADRQFPLKVSTEICHQRVNEAA